VDALRALRKKKAVSLVLFEVRKGLPAFDKQGFH
jgi:hypothetical protein